MTKEQSSTQSLKFVDIAAGRGPTAGYVYVLRENGEVYFTARGATYLTKYLPVPSPNPGGRRYTGLAAGCDETSGYVYCLRDDGEVYFTSRGTGSWTLYRGTASPPPSSSYAYTDIETGCGNTAGYLYILRADGMVYYTARGTCGWTAYIPVAAPLPAGSSFVGIAVGATTTTGYVYILRNDGEVYFADRGTSSWVLYRSSSSPPPVSQNYVDIAAGSGTTAGYLYILRNDGEVYYTSRGTTGWTLYRASGVPPPSSTAYVGIAAGSNSLSGYVYVQRDDANVYFTDKGTSNWELYTSLQTVVPTAPQNLQAYAGNEKVTLCWSPPASDGGSPVTNYRLYRGTSAGGETFLIELGNVLIHNDTGLTNGMTYYYRVSAKNSVGEGPLSNEVSATPTAVVQVPSAPRNLQAIPGDRKNTLIWESPVSDGGAEITGYKIYRGYGSGQEIYLTSVGAVLTYRDSGLKNGMTYYYQVSAVNSVGESERSNEASATPSWAALDHVTVSPGSFILETGKSFSEIVVTAWADAAENDEILIGLGYAWSVVPQALGMLNTTTSKIVTFTAGGAGGTGKLFVNVSYRGAVKQAYVEVVVSATPVTLDSVTVTPAASKQRIGESRRFTAHGWSSGYELGGVNFSWSVAPEILGNLDSNTSKSVIFTASSTGKGKLFVNGTYRAVTIQAFAEIEIRELSVPDPPGNLCAVGEEEQILLSWTPPADDGGRPITNYRIYRSLRSGEEMYLTEIGETHTYTDTNVTAGIVYYYQVTAVNSIGESARSNEAHATPKTRKLPDLTVTFVDTAISRVQPKAGDIVVIKAIVRNIGKSNATSVEVAFYDNQAQIDAIQIIQFLAINGSAQVNISWNAKKGSHIIEISVDPHNKIDELNETNNNATVQIQVRERETGLESFAWFLIMLSGILVVITVIALWWVRSKKSRSPQQQINMCVMCKKPLVYSKEYNRSYCPNCRRYV